MKKRFMKRGLSLLLALAMILGMVQLPVMTQEVQAEDESTRNITLYVGETQTITDESGDYTDSDISGNLDTDIAAVNVETIESELTPATEIVSGKKYWIDNYRKVNNGYENTILTSTPSSGKLALSGEIGDKTQGSLWTIEKNNDGTYYIYNKDNQYLNIGNGTASVVSADNAPELNLNLYVEVKYDSNAEDKAWALPHWLLSVDTYYLNQYGGGETSVAAGDNKASLSAAKGDNGNYWNIYKAYDTQISFTGVAVGNTSVIVGDTTYNIEVLSVPEKTVELYVGETKTVRDDTKDYTTGTIENESVAAMEIVDVAAETTSQISTNPATSFIDGASYLICFENTTNAITTTEEHDSWTGYHLAARAHNGVADATNTWTLEAVGTGYKIKSAAGYLALGASTNQAAVSAAGEVFYFEGTEGTTTAWAIGNDISAWPVNSSNRMYINALGGTTTLHAGGWTGNGSKLNLYEVTSVVENPAYTDITFKGLEAGTTTARVGNVQYNIVVKESIQIDPSNILVHDYSGIGELKNVDNNDVTQNKENVKTQLFDGNPLSYWNSNSVSAVAKGSPYLILNLQNFYNLSQIAYTPRWHGTEKWGCTGNIEQLIVEVSADGLSWKEVTPTGGYEVSSGFTAKVGEYDAYPVTIAFDEVTAQYIRFSSTKSFHWDTSQLNTSITIGDLKVFGNNAGNLEETNVAYKKPVSKDANHFANNDKPLTNITNGTIPTTTPPSADYGEFAVANDVAGSSYIEIDLNDVYDLYRLNLYRYWEANDARTYNGTVIVLAEDNTKFTLDGVASGAAKIVYNSDSSNVHGFGEGTDSLYPEKSSGKVIELNDYVSARFIRVYMNGSNQGANNHIVELQAWALVSIPMENAGYLELPTYDYSENGKTKVDGEVHPDIVDMSEYIDVSNSTVDSDGKWHGYRYYMAVTPNQNGDSQYENPYLLASNDGTTWDKLKNLEYPLTGIARENEPYHNCDADLVYNEDTDELYLYYIWSDDATTSDTDDHKSSQLRFYEIAWDDEKGHLYSVSGLTPIVSMDRTAKTYSVLSPSIIKDGDTWKMWCVDTDRYQNGYASQVNHVDYRVSADGINWSSEVSLASTFDQNGYVPWHIDVNKVDTDGDGVDDEYWAVYPAYPKPSGTSAATDLFYAKSSDGLVWTTYAKPLLKPDTSSWDNQFIYRSTFLYNSTDGEFRLWYSGGAGTAAGWRIGYTHNSYIDMVRALGATTTPSITAPDEPQFPTIAAVNKTELAAAIAEAETLKENKYTPASWAVFAEGLALAKAMNANTDATQAEVDALKTELLRVKEKLEALKFAPDDIVVDFAGNLTINFEQLDGIHIEKGKTSSGCNSDIDHNLTITGNSENEAWSISYPTGIITETDVVTLTDSENNEYSFNVYPATNTYYDNVFADVGNNYDAYWDLTNSLANNQLPQIAATKVGEAGNYGYEDNVSSSTYIQAKQIGSNAAFEFAGTGLDIYANSTANTGMVLVQIKDSQNAVEKMELINTALKPSATDAALGLSNVTTTKSVPIVSVPAGGLTHGTHTATLTHVKKNVDKAPTDKIIIDGFRVYETLTDAQAGTVYEKDAERNPVYVSLRDQVIASLQSSAATAEEAAEEIVAQADAAAGTTAGVVVLSDSKIGYTAENLQDFLNNSSKNELYLYPGQSLVFSVENTANLQLGLRALAGEVLYSVNEGTEKTMTSNVDMFYSVPTVDNGDGTYTVTITNNSAAGTSAILAITKLKAFPASGSVTFGGLRSEDLTTALTSLGYESEVSDINEITRMYGSTRYETSFAAADEFKTQLGADKFDAVIVATGKKFADALSGSYLASVKNAPILLTNEKRVDELVDYVKANLAENGTVYILGGDAAIPETVETELADYIVKRLAGSTRYETNIEILEEAGVNGGEILVATGTGFADSLSASATGKPILLVKDEITDAHSAILEQYAGGKIYIIGGTGAVNADVEAELNGYGSIYRVSGATRYETSVEVAKTFFANADAAVLASAKEFPDGLCGGPLAAAMNMPLILTAEGKTDAAAAYMQEMGIESGFVLGGGSRIADDSVREIFGLESNVEIIVK